MQDLAVQALEALKRKDYQSARDYIVAFAEKDPLELQHFMVKGLAELALKDWAAAHDTFAEAIDDYPYQSQLWASLGEAQENLGQIESAVVSLTQSLELKADQADVVCGLSRLYSKQGFYALAEDFAHRAYEGGAPKAQALNALGMALMGQNKLEAAEKVMNEALRLDVGNALLLAGLSELARRKAGGQIYSPSDTSDGLK